MAVVLRVVYVCTVHRQTLQDGTWTEDHWKEVMEQRHGLILHEGICNRCMSDARRVLHTQLEARGWTILTTPAPTAALSAAKS